MEELAVRLHMLRNRNRIQKAYKPEALRIARVQVTKLTEQALIDRIIAYIDALEVM